MLLSSNIEIKVLVLFSIFLELQDSAVVVTWYYILCFALHPLNSSFQIKKYRSKGGLTGPDGAKSVFGQACSKMSNFGPDSLFLPHRVWKVKFIGESVDDCGGGYSESIAEMCDELQNGSLPLLIVTPNGRDESGANRDCFILSPDACSPVHLSMFKFLGVLIGIAIRTGSPLSLNLAEPVWQQLAGKTVLCVLFGFVVFAFNRVQC